MNNFMQRHKYKQLLSKYDIIKKGLRQLDAAPEYRFKIQACILKEQVFLVLVSVKYFPRVLCDKFKFLNKPRKNRCFKLEISKKHLSNYSLLFCAGLRSPYLFVVLFLIQFIRFSEQHFLLNYLSSIIAEQ